VSQAALDKAPPPEAVTTPPKVIPRKHPGRWVAAGLVLALSVAIVVWAATNEGFGWGEFGDYLFEPVILTAVKNTMVLAVLAQVISLVLGTLLAVMRMSENKVIAGFAFFYAWFFRGVPVMVILIFVFFAAAVLPRIGWGAMSIDTNDLFAAPFIAALIGFGLNDAAYTSEIVRAGLMSVPKGQTEAAHALGMGPIRTIWRIVLPQALRIIIPPAGNAFISMLKLTSIATVIGYPELMNTVRSIYSSEFNTIPLLLVASFWYLVLTTVLSVGQHYIERYYGKGFERR